MLRIFLLSLFLFSNFSIFADLRSDLEIGREIEGTEWIDSRRPVPAPSIR